MKAKIAIAVFGLSLIGCTHRLTVNWETLDAVYGKTSLLQKEQEKNVSDTEPNVLPLFNPQPDPTPYPSAEPLPRYKATRPTPVKPRTEASRAPAAPVVRSPDCPDGCVVRHR